MLVILSRDPHPVQGSTIERAFVLCMTAYNEGAHAVQICAYRIPLSQRMPKAFLARLDSPALPDQPEPPMYVPGPLSSEPLMCRSLC
jgi:hypothetical protein